MARVFKPKFFAMRTVRDSGGNIVYEETIAKRGPRKGQKIKAPKRERILDSEGDPVIRAVRKWSIEYTDELGRRTTVPGYVDRKATDQKAAKLELHVAHYREGLVAVSLRHRETLLIVHVEEWIASIELKRSPNYVRMARSRIRRLARELRDWKTLKNFPTTSLESWIDANKGEGKGKLAPRTVNHYVETASAFFGWCVKTKRCAANPLGTFEKERVYVDANPRRAASVDELQRLVAVHPQRGFVYLTAALTGLRRNELKLLEWGDLKLDTPVPFLKLRAHTTKSKRADTLSLTPELVSEMRSRRQSDWVPDDRVFATIPTPRTVKRDLERAGIEPKTSDGKIVLHALRNSLATMLYDAGVSEVKVQQLMRHTDPALTRKSYMDPRHFDLQRETEKLPRLLGKDDVPERQRATGTDALVANLRTTYAGTRPRMSAKAHTVDREKGNNVRVCPQTPRSEREGFEPSVRLPAHRISSAAPSATRTPLHTVHVGDRSEIGRTRPRTHDVRS